MSILSFQHDLWLITPHAITGSEVLWNIRETCFNIITYNTFPEWIQESEIPDFVQESWRKVQEHGLSPKKQSQISYYINNEWNWCMEIRGVARILMTNEIAPHNPSEGIHVEQENTYFLQPAAQKYAQDKGRLLPDKDILWKMVDFFGGFQQFKDILQMPFVGHLVMSKDGTVENLMKKDDTAEIWSADDWVYLHIHDHNNNSVNYTGSIFCTYTSWWEARTIRLLDRLDRTT